MRHIFVLAVVGLVACSGNDQTDGGMINPMDAGMSFDATVVDGSARDSGAGDPVDGGFADPSTILQGIENILGQRTYMHIRGTLTSTMPPVFFLSTGPMQGYEYLLEPFEFLLGPGGVTNPDRLLIFADLRGAGRSGFGSIGSSTVSFEAHLGDVERYMDHVEDKLGVTGPYDLIGHGYGAGVAVNYQVLHPDRVNRMVLISPHPTNTIENADFMGEWDSRLTSQDRARLEQLRRWFNCLPDLQRCSREIWNVMGPAFFCPANKSQFQTMRFEYIDLRPFYFFVLPNLIEDQYDWAPVLTRVSAPTTVFEGVCDPANIQSPVPAKYSSTIPGAEHITMPMSGHFPFVEEPQSFQTQLKRVLLYP